VPEPQAPPEKQGPSYADFLARLLREELHAQQERSLEHRIRRARLPERWALETFPFEKQPGVRKAVIQQLASLDFIPRAENLVLIGETGVGKTGIASGLRPRISSTRCTPRSPTARPESFSTASSASISYTLTSLDI
jgi:DNA replication protein DnaC